MKTVNSTESEWSAEDSRQAPQRDWVSDLSDPGLTGQGALLELHALLLRAARHQIWRLSHVVPGAGASELEDLAQQAANDAAIAVLRQLHTFQGRSRFTTWAYKFGVLHAGVAVRRQAWRHREVPLSDVLSGLPSLVDRTDSPEAAAEGNELADAVRSAIATRLTPHQRRVTLALVVESVPIDVLAERLGTNRNALYKTLHDARQRLRTVLIEQGHLQSSLDGSTR